ncbi:SRPBCC domain-containing protein [Cellulomonas sp. DKR-3]|uniref:SRPBCC domain-containing protein n=1 Tax=Cellulomonas fulva TaxID=2835530 RepID=A0ABS5TYZ2_9CELL|nr:SRPBCC domain-containing protein [Cellulomonas fulva]MBT0994375.1 SRPBCC domain-containing protein [Cellulomonas fulva]
MTVVSSTKDAEALSLEIVSEFSATPDRVWQVWEDARQLERWWGPPEWPATFVDHDVRVGGRSSYFMTGPDGTKAHGWWEFVAVDAPRSLSFDDGFADDTGRPTDSMPVTRAVVRIEEVPAGTRMTITSTFPTLEALEQLVAMGMLEGMTLALGQIDAILADA